MICHFFKYLSPFCFLSIKFHCTFFIIKYYHIFFMKGTKLKGKGEVVGRVSGVVVGRAREGAAMLLSGRLMRCVVEWKEVSSRLMWVRVKIEREFGV